MVYNGLILTDIYLYASWFDCSFVPRVCNRVAGELAHLASSGVVNIWIEETPEEIIHLLFFDSAVE